MHVATCAAIHNKSFMALPKVHDCREAITATSYQVRTCVDAAAHACTGSTVSITTLHQHILQYYEVACTTASASTPYLLAAAPVRTHAHARHQRSLFPSTRRCCEQDCLWVSSGSRHTYRCPSFALARRTLHYKVPGGATSDYFRLKYEVQSRVETVIRTATR